MSKSYYPTPDECPMNRCPFLLTSGQHKGECCSTNAYPKYTFEGRKYCATHGKKVLADDELPPKKTKEVMEKDLNIDIDKELENIRDEVDEVLCITHESSSDEVEAPKPTRKAPARVPVIKKEPVVAKKVQTLKQKVLPSSSSSEEEEEDEDDESSDSDEDFKKMILKKNTKPNLGKSTLSVPNRVIDESKNVQKPPAKKFSLYGL